MIGFQQVRPCCFAIMGSVGLMTSRTSEILLRRENVLPIAFRRTAQQFGSGPCQYYDNTHPTWREQWIMSLSALLLGVSVTVTLLNNSQSGQLNARPVTLQFLSVWNKPVTAESVKLHEMWAGFLPKGNKRRRRFWRSICISRRKVLLSLFPRFIICHTGTWFPSSARVKFFPLSTRALWCIPLTLTSSFLWGIHVKYTGLFNVWGCVCVCVRVCSRACTSARMYVCECTRACV